MDIASFDGPVTDDPAPGLPRRPLVRPEAVSPAHVDLSRWAMSTQEVERRFDEIVALEAMRGRRRSRSTD